MSRVTAKTGEHVAEVEESGHVDSYAPPLAQLTGRLLLPAPGRRLPPATRQALDTPREAVSRVPAGPVVSNGTFGGPLCPF